jgi:hypothetical protein
MKLYGYDWPHGGTKQVVYVDDQGHVLSWRWDWVVHGALQTLRG